MTPKLCPVAIGIAAVGHLPGARARVNQRNRAEVGLLQSVLKAWSACELDESGRQTLLLSQVVERLPAIASCVPGGQASLQRRMLIREFFRPDAPANAVRRSFLQRLNAEGGEVHFLYFWRAFSEVARLVSILPSGIGSDEDVPSEAPELTMESVVADSLASELEASRDRALGLLRLRVTKKEWTRDMNWSAALSRQTVAMSALASAIHATATKSSAPAFWQVATTCLSEYDGLTEISLEQLTKLMLRWLDNAIVGQWDTGQEDSLPALKRPQKHENDKGALECISVDASRQTAQTPVFADTSTEGTPVFLNIYDAFQDANISWVNSLLAPNGSKWRLGGAFHAGVEVAGLEWSYGSSAPGETGLAWNPPKCHTQHNFRQSISLGNTLLSPDLITDVLTDLCEEYRGDDYHMLRFNCCHFAEDFCQRLAVERVPAWVHRLARLFANAEGLALGVTRGLTSCSCTKVEFNESHNKDRENRAQWLYRL